MYARSGVLALSFRFLYPRSGFWYHHVVFCALVLVIGDPRNIRQNHPFRNNLSRSPDTFHIAWNSLQIISLTLTLFILSGLQV